MLDTRIARQWDDDIVPQLIDYIKLPAKSPNFDPEWRGHGQIEAAIVQAHRWAARPVATRDRRGAPVWPRRRG